MKKEKAIEEIISDLGAEILQRRLDIVDKTKKGKKVSESELIVLAELQEQFKGLESTYLRMKKISKASGKGEAGFSEEVMKKIKRMKSPLAEIVQKH